MSSAQKTVEELLARADIKVGGGRPWDIEVHNPDFYNRVLKDAGLALGESYMDGWWDAVAIDQLIVHLIKARLHEQVRGDARLRIRMLLLVLRNMQSRARAYQVGEKHYDIGNDLYAAMLDKRMIYSCGYWSSPAGEAADLDEAQEAKLDLICRKMGLQAGMHVLDVGCGWGGLAAFAAEKYGVRVTGITVSKEQVELGRKVVQNLPVTIRLQDYRDITGTYDRIISVGMFEHVGVKNYRTYMRIVRDHLADDGLFLLHTIGSSRSTKPADPWMTKYIFPNGKLPSAAQTAVAADKLLVLEDWHNFGADYDKTIMAWHANFEAAWPALRDAYDDRFYRMWRYYLLYCAGSFRARNTHLWQIVFSPRGVPGGYQTVR